MDAIVGGGVVGALLLFGILLRMAQRGDPTLLLERLGDAMEVNAALRRQLEDAAREREELRKRLGHKPSIRRDSDGKSYFACAACGLDLYHARFLPGLEGCGGVRLEDAEWQAKLAALAKVQQEDRRGCVR